MTVSGSSVSEVEMIDGAGFSNFRLVGTTSCDLLDFNVASHSRGTSVDRISDFGVGVDIIDLSTINADGTLGAGDSFLFIGATAFSGVAGELRIDTTSVAGVSRIPADLDGSRSVDMEIQLDGTHNLSQNDFLL